MAVCNGNPLTVGKISVASGDRTGPLDQYASD